MDRLIDELAFYSKIHGNKLPYNFEKTSINAFVEGLSREIATDMEAANIAFDYTSNVKSDTIVVLDIEQFKRAVNNIISNAGNNGANTINRKVDFVRKYMKDSWGVDIELLRNAILRRGSRISKLNLNSLK